MTVYDVAHMHATDKTTYINDVTERILNVMLSAFQYDGLPDTVPQMYLERQILTNGHVGFFKNKGKIYALTGQTDTNGVYGESVNYQISNIPLGINQSFTIGKNVSIVRNDAGSVGVLPTIQKYASLMCDADITLDTADILSRIMLLITAPDDRSKQAADMFVRKIDNGDFTVIGDNAFFDGVKVQQASSGNNAIGSVIQLMQYYKASMYNDLGLQANWNTKKESLNSSEVGMNDDVLLPYIDNMLSTRQHDIADVNKMFGLDITVGLSSAWAKNHDDSSQDSENETQNTDTSDSVDTDGASPTVANESVQGGSPVAQASDNSQQSDTNSDNPAQPDATQANKPDSDTSTTEKVETQSAKPTAADVKVQADTVQKTVTKPSDSTPSKPETSRPVKEDDRIRVKKDIRKEKDSKNGNNK